MLHRASIIPQVSRYWIWEIYCQCSFAYIVRHLI